jgi:hypothetical protein
MGNVYIILEAICMIDELQEDIRLKEATEHTIISLADMIINKPVMETK